MYDNLSLYYLNKMGIIPWINRAKPSKTSPICDSKIEKMFVIMPSQCNTKSKYLLKQIESFVDLDENRVEHITYNDQILSLVVDGYLNRMLLGVLCFDSNTSLSEKLKPFVDQNLLFIDLESLISFPKMKKQAFADLVQFKENAWSRLKENGV
ncbi:hypothetical protein [Legionella waltersii]|uniref:Uncharacterized protein n=1 Tax=Legionella waltersii TaxID=66969 RepID=A0A0W1ALS7_9GAMM|nr:hypothetical protein [Legionella waltersii]KTD82273.1 hypothetical protein Lwal_0750 [Legionella waltersii]SNV04345.1 Uncharacterised protein [Legionella waltersii]